MAGATGLYKAFLGMKTSKQWKKIGVSRRGGVATPLFSLYSKSSVGIGEIPDLMLLADWVKSAGMSIIQLLPMNDVGFDFRPYDAQSTFALDCMYLALGELEGADAGKIKKKIAGVKEKFPTGGMYVDYGIKRAKLDLLWELFSSRTGKDETAFGKYVRKNKFWLKNYVLFKVIKEKCGQSSWENWPPELKARDPEALARFEKGNSGRMQFHMWLQWQLDSQFRKVKDYAASRGVLLMGDLPFLVSRDSADVWAHQEYFKLDLASGAPPDLYFWKGQRWGMPPYHWENMAANGYDYLVERLQYAENFYDFFRIDHFVGLFRLWTISLGEPLENGGLNGVFDPRDESLWEEHGRKLLTVMTEATDMLPCAEDLGVIPPCSYKVLREFAVPGMEVQRWAKDWGRTYDFIPAEKYRENSIAVISTHDMHSFRGWWAFEAGTADAGLFERLCQIKQVDFTRVKSELFDPKRSIHGRLRWKEQVGSVDFLLSSLRLGIEEAFQFADMYKASFNEKQRFWEYLGLNGTADEKCSLELMEAALRKASGSSSVFSVQLLQDWLSLDESIECDPATFRINFPGTMDEKNWRLVLPLSLEQMSKWAVTKAVKEIHRGAGRI